METLKESDFLEKKEKLPDYKFGDRLSLVAFENEELEVSDMERVGIAVFGPTGSGKTSFIGTAERALLGTDKQTAFDKCATDVEGTVILERFLPALNINLLDTRGFWGLDIYDNPTRECRNILSGRTREGDFIAREHDRDEPGFNVCARYMASFGNRVHGVIFVLRADDERLKGGVYLNKMEMIRDYLSLQGYRPITVITCEDKINNDYDREVALASAATGSPIDRTFFITNYTSKNTEYSLKTEKQVLDVLDTALHSAERFVMFQKLREQRYWRVIHERSKQAHRKKIARHSAFGFIVNVYEITLWLPCTTV